MSPLFPSAVIDQMLVRGQITRVAPNRAQSDQLLTQAEAVSDYEVKKIGVLRCAHHLEYILYMTADMTVSQARADLGAVTSRAEYGGETTYLTKHGHRAAAVVPAAAAELLEQLEDLVDEQAVRTALASLRSGDEERVPFVRRTRRQTA